MRNKIKTVKKELKLNSKTAGRMGKTDLVKTKSNTDPKNFFKVNKNPNRSKLQGIFNPPTGKLLSQQAAEILTPVRGNKNLSNIKNKPDTSKRVDDFAKIKAEIDREIKARSQKHILEQRQNADQAKLKTAGKAKKIKKYVKTGIPGFDELFDEGIPSGNSVLVAGGAGSGKTIFCLQALAYHANLGENCFYMSFEENEERLKQHMEDFGFEPDKLIKSGKLKIQRTSPFDITRSVDAMLAKEKGELLIDIDPVILPKGFKPEFIVLDSLTAIASAFSGKEDSYRIYIERLFRFFEQLGSTVFLITETRQIPEIFSTSGVEEFLADGVIVLYNIKRGDVRENAIEVLKMRGEKHQKKIVAMQITDEGIVVYPEQEVFGDIS